MALASAIAISCKVKLDTSLLFYVLRRVGTVQCIYHFLPRERTTEDPRYNDNICYQRFCCKIELAVIKKLDVDPSTDIF